MKFQKKRGKWDVKIMFFFSSQDPNPNNKSALFTNK